jgi:hypothetical protein
MNAQGVRKELDKEEMLQEIVKQENKGRGKIRMKYQTDHMMM